MFLLEKATATFYGSIEIWNVCEMGAEGCEFLNPAFHVMLNGVPKQDFFFFGIVPQQYILFATDRTFMEIETNTSEKTLPLYIFSVMTGQSDHITMSHFQ